MSEDIDNLEFSELVIERDGLTQAYDRLSAENAKLQAEVEEWKDETNYYQAQARKLRAALEQAKTLILAASLHFNHQIGPFGPQESWQKDADKWLAALNEETK